MIRRKRGGERGIKTSETRARDLSLVALLRRTVC